MPPDRHGDPSSSSQGAPRWAHSLPGQSSPSPRHLCGPQLVFRKPWGELARL